MASWNPEPGERRSMPRSLAVLFVVAYLAALIGVLIWARAASSAPPRKAPPRAARILSGLVAGRWICPMLPNGRVVVSAEACFRTGAPEPELP